MPVSTTSTGSSFRQRPSSETKRSRNVKSAGSGSSGGRSVHAWGGGSITSSTTNKASEGTGQPQHHSNNNNNNNNSNSSGTKLARIPSSRGNGLMLASRRGRGPGSNNSIASAAAASANGRRSPGAVDRLPEASRHHGHHGSRRGEESKKLHFNSHGHARGRNGNNNNNNNNNSGSVGGANHSAALRGVSHVPAGMEDHMPRRVDASALSQHEVMKMLEQQGVIPTGFHAEDCAKLQKRLDNEYQEKLEAFESMLAAASEEARATAAAARLARLAMRERLEEEIALRKRPDISEWLDLVVAGKAAAFAHFTLRSSLARYIAKKLPDQSVLRSLSLMRNKLGDDTGVIFGELVARTKSLRQLNLGENRLGPKTLIAIGRGLAQNSSLQSVGLEHNDLTSDGFNFDGVNQFAEALTKNRTLTAANFTSCKLHTVGCQLLAQALNKNPVVVMLDVSHNRADQQVQIVIAARLNTNRQNRLEVAKEAQRQAILQRKAELRKLAEEEEAERQRAEALWIQEQRRLRNEQRLEAAEDERKARVQAAIDARAAEKLAADEAARAAKAKKKRKGRKKKKGKGKGAAKKKK